MSSVGSDTQNPSSFYSRKDKSLGLLCSKFIKLYDREGVEFIGLDNAAIQLGVERRRIYDIVNILESIGVLARKAKNQYYWKGFSAIPQALHELQTGKEHEWPPRKTIMQEKPSGSSKNDNRKEKSLGLLTRNFVRLFINSDAKMISLDNAATVLLGDAHDPTSMRKNCAAKVRRLYDIANVFASMNLIEKLRDPESGKPAFRWLGVKGNTKNPHETTLNSNEPKRRVFGTEITNTGPKKFKTEPLLDLRSSQKVNVPTHAKQDNLKIEDDENLMKQHLGNKQNDFVYGPFTPASVASTRVSENKIDWRLQDWEHLASTYRPRYQNQALNDLFAHYSDAWKSWFVEVAEKKEVQPSP